MLLRHIMFRLMLLVRIGALASLLTTTAGAQSVAHGSQANYMFDAHYGRVGSFWPKDFRLAQGGTPNDPVPMSRMAKIRPVDIVFVFDATESMQPYIDRIKSTMVSFLQTLKETNRDPRFGLVTFEDYVISAQPDYGCPYRRQHDIVAAVAEPGVGKSRLRYRGFE